MQLVSGGQTTVNADGEIGPFLRNARGVGKGNPLSLILFNFMVDSLAATISHANAVRHISRAVPHLIPRK
jgi:hypothetical protein